MLAVLLYLRSVLKTPENRPPNGKSPVFPRAIATVRALDESPNVERSTPMKTRIIQDEPRARRPGGGPTGARPVDEPRRRMARWSAHHRKMAIFGWLGCVIAVFAIGNFVVGQKLIVFETSGPGESGRADKIIYEDFKQPAGESVLVQSETLTASDPAFRATVQAVIAGVSNLDAVAKVESPFDTENAGQISDDRKSVLVPMEIKGLSDDAADKIDPVVARVKELQNAHPEFTIGSFGESTGKEVNAAFFDDLKKAGLYSIPLTLIILLVAFGALVAAGIPLLLGLTAVLGAMGLVAIISQVLPMSDAVAAIILLIGLAVGVDYTMFYLKREREERAAGRSEEAALEAAAATSGRSVLISGLTVLVAMAGMFFTRDAGFISFGVATMTVVAVAMLGSLTVLPALLSKLGDNVDRLRVPFVHRLRRDDGEGRIWGAIIDRVLRHPVVSVVLAGGLLVAIAFPAYQLKTAQPSIDTYPQKFLVTYNRLKAAFPGTENTAQVVIKATNVDTTAVNEAIGQLRWRALDSGVMNEPIDVDVNAAKTVAVVNIPTEGSGTDATSEQALATLRDEIIPPTLGTLTGAEVAVTGNTAYAQGLRRPDEDSDSARLRLRVAVRVRADAGVLPLDRDRDEGGAAQPALGRRRLRGPRPRLPARLGEGAPGLRVHRRDRSLPADPPVRDPLRPVDGLPRLHPQPDPRGLRQGHEH